MSSRRSLVSANAPALSILSISLLTLGLLTGPA